MSILSPLESSNLSRTRPSYLDSGRWCHKTRPRPRSQYLGH